MCRYCNTYNCWICTTQRNTKKCLQCVNHSNFSFNWNYCPYCGERYRVLQNGFEYLRAYELDTDDGRKTYRCYSAPLGRQLIKIDKDGNIEYTGNA